MRRQSLVWPTWSLNPWFTTHEETIFGLTHLELEPMIYHTRGDNLWFDPPRAWTHDLPHEETIFGLTHLELEPTIYHTGGDNLWFDPHGAWTHDLPHTRRQSLVWPTWSLNPRFTTHEETIFGLTHLELELTIYHMRRHSLVWPTWSLNPRFTTHEETIFGLTHLELEPTIYHTWGDNLWFDPPGAWTHDLPHTRRQSLVWPTWSLNPRFTTQEETIFGLTHLELEPTIYHTRGDNLWFDPPGAWTHDLPHMTRHSLVWPTWSLNPRFTTHEETIFGLTHLEHEPTIYHRRRHSLVWPTWSLNPRFTTRGDNLWIDPPGAWTHDLPHMRRQSLVWPTWSLNPRFTTHEETFFGLTHLELEPTIYHTRGDNLWIDPPGAWTHDLPHMRRQSLVWPTWSLNPQFTT